MSFDRLDLNLLLIFDALMRTRSVTLAGQRVGLSQSATSSSLQRLRDAFGDPLFVRTPKGMQPSALALELEADIRHALDRLRYVVERERSFDPGTATRTFRVLVSDIAQMVHMPSFIATLRARAPLVDLVNVALPLHEAKEAMAAGELDITVGFIPDLGADFHRQSLFVDRWVCVVCRSHPGIGDRLSRQQYLEAPHISYRPAASIHSTLDQMLETQFLGQGVRRRIMLSVPYSSGLGALIAGTDLIFTAPLGLANAIKRHDAVKLLPLPFELPSIDLNLQWHERMHRDPGNQWLRQTFAVDYCDTYLSDPVLTKASAI